MIATDQIRGPARRARLGGMTAARARRRGRLDAPGLRPLLPALPLPEPGTALLDLPEIVTPFVMETRAGALRAVGQLRSRLLRDQRRAIIRIHAESVRVVTQYDVRAEPSPAALARYGAMVGAWRADAGLCRARATALTHEANQRLACYWDAVWLAVHTARAEEHRRAEERRREELRRRAAELRRARRQHPIPAPARAPEQPGEPHREPARGERDRPAYPPFTARPAHWLPGRIALDATWEEVDGWLLTGGSPAQSPPPDARTPAVVRALEILDTQPHGAGTGHRPRHAADQGRASQ
ncbi:hypothetical protein DEJ50_04795 [Streptomyces venezuelae]|uniref:Uncharacterized protein n=1 Tax=Streptomyces venezuelae TaxID=54571 RepID=A0A5P2CY97_STRVZ|nr:hypothetical protein [Streptomyces venezuelae]QES47250.1 hypothetical protein DEJ50_04795 [Streptomyces venezuelae]